MFQRFIILILLFCFAIGHIQAAPETTEHHTSEVKEEGFDANRDILNHVKDSYDWHLFDIGETSVAVPLPVILYSPDIGLDIFMSSKFEHGHATVKGYSLTEGTITRADQATFYDFSMTKNVVGMLISTALLLLIFIKAANASKKIGTKQAPKGLLNFIEPLVIFVRDEIVKPSIGHKYMRFMPLMLTMFFFIWLNNMLGLVPGGANFTGNIAVTGCLALVSLIMMVATGNKHFWGHMFNPPGVPGWVKFILVPIEFISLFIKPMALMIRLFANMLAGHIIVLSVISLIFIFGALSPALGWSFSVISVLFTVFMFLLEVLVAAIQAFIFTNLTAVFIGQSVEEGHDHDYEKEDYHPVNPETGQEYNVSEEAMVI